MTFRKKEPESGSAAFAGIASIATLALATLMVQQTNMRVKSGIDAAKQLRGREASTIGADNSLARFKALISPRKVSTDVYIPSVFAVNYYDPLWKLMQKTGANSNGSYSFNSGNEGKVKASKQNLSDNDIRSLMMGSSFASMAGVDSYSIDVIKPNFEDDPNKKSFGQLVKTVDVVVTGKAELADQGKVSRVSARVPIAPPVPYNPKIMYRKSGTTDPLKEVQQDEDLSGGTFDFFIVASGIAFDGELFVDGTSVARSGGFGPDGRIIHQAVNYEAKDVAISEAIPLKLQAEKAETPPPTSGGGSTEVDQGDSFNQATCTYIPSGGAAGGGAAGGGGPIAAGGSVTGTKTLSAIVYGPDGETTVKTEEFKVKAEAPAATGAAVAGATNDGTSVLTQGDYANLCSGEDECTWVPTDIGNGAELGRVASYFRPTKDISSYYTFKQGQDPGKWGIFKKKVCFNFSKADNSAHNLQFSDAIVVVYDTSNCTKKNLFQRTTCGCVTADTMITMGDGKTQKRIDEIYDQDTVWNPVTKRAYPIRKITRGPEKIPLIEIKIAGKSIRATGNHPFITRHGIAPAFELKSGDEILVDGERFSPIEESQVVVPPKNQEPPVVWNIEIEAPDHDHDAHNYVANGITTGDLMIQKKLQSGLIK